MDVFPVPCPKKPEKKAKPGSTAKGVVKKRPASSAAGAVKEDFLIHQGSLKVTYATKQSYVQCLFGEKLKLIVGVNAKACPGHKEVIQKVLKFCQREGVKKSEAVARRDSLLKK